MVYFFRESESVDAVGMTAGFYHDYGGGKVGKRKSRILILQLLTCFRAVLISRSRGWRSMIDSPGTNKGIPCSQASSLSTPPSSEGEVTRRRPRQ